MKEVSNRSDELHEAEELLLSKYFDHETSFFERIAARRLLNRSSCARRYLGVLEQTQRSLRRELPEIRASLWTRISARLHQEERSALLLGRRSVVDERPARSGLWLTGGAAAALMAAAIFVMLPRISTFSPRGGPIASVQRGVPFASGVSTGSEVFARRAPVSVGVDWMRSDGRLQMVHGPDERAPVIYIKRRANRMAPVVQESNSQGIVIQERSAPHGITVSD